MISLERKPSSLSMMRRSFSTPPAKKDLMVSLSISSKLFQFFTRKSQRQQHAGIGDNEHPSLHTTQYKPYRIFNPVLKFLQCLTDDTAVSDWVVALTVLRAITDGDRFD